MKFLKLKISIIFAIIGVSSVLAVYALSNDQSLSPKLQWMMGIPINEISCKSGYDLAIKNSDNSPACVKKETAKKLLESGWAKEIIAQANGKFSDTWHPMEESSRDLAAMPASSGASSGGFLSPGSFAMQESLQLSKRMGFSVGGAKDIDNFRENIENNFLPLYSDVTYEGLFYDYYFETGEKTECKKLFCPSYSYALSKDPFSQDDQYYLSVGLNSGLKEEDFERKKLNLVIVLDVSGSMSSPFDQYYYDDPRGHLTTYQNLTDEQKEDLTKTKMDLANKSIVSLIDHLNEDDNLGIVLFDDNAHVSKPLENLGATNIQKLKENILSISSGGGTNLNSGMIKGTHLFDDIEFSPEYENRIIFLTDAMPNISDTTPEGHLGKLTENSKNNIFTTFIGIGVDFNTELVELISKVKGANYYSVHSSIDFNQRMNDEFELMVTPLVFDLTLNLESEEYSIQEVYGSPDADKATGEIMKVSTLFPSRIENGETRGGIILIKLENSKDYGTITLKTNYVDRNGNHGEDSSLVILNKDHKDDYFDNSGIQKGILLSRYANLMKTWAYDERKAHNDIFRWETIPNYHDDGIYLPKYVDQSLGEWERQSIPLKVSSEYQVLFEEFLQYYEEQAKQLDDNDLEQEKEILEKLLNL